MNFFKEKWKMILNLSSTKSQPNNNILTYSDGEQFLWCYEICIDDLNK